MIIGGVTYPRRLIEVDLPIAQVSKHARDGRSVHHGHITAIHIWWARKPLPSCRAAALAALLIDPDDPECPQHFCDRAAGILAEVYETEFAKRDLRAGLLRFISDFASWQHAGNPRFRDAAQALTTAAHTAIFGDMGPAFMADPFCGGGSIPLEGLRLGAATYASDLNPVATLISKVTLEYVQRFGDRLFAEIERAGAAIAASAQIRLASFYPEVDDQIPVAYLSFRRIRCEGPNCGADVVLTSKFHLARRGANSVGLRLAGWDGQTPRFAIAEGPLTSFPPPTVRRGAATCLRCGYTMPVERVRAQLTGLAGGAHRALLAAVATTDADGKRRAFRLPVAADHQALAAAARAVAALDDQPRPGLPLLPSEPLPPIGTLGFRVQRYGMLRWRDLFTPRQLLTISTLVGLVRDTLPHDRNPDGLGVAVRSCLALAVDRVCDYQNTGCSWNPSGSALPHLFTRQALPIIWDYGEANPLAASSGSWSNAIEHLLRGLRNAQVSARGADVGLASASRHPLPTDCAHLLVTDPPYYDAIPYADLSDFFYVWLRRMLADDHPNLFDSQLVRRAEECIVNPVAGKDRDYYRRVMTDALAEARRVTRPDGIGVIIFAHKSTTGWEDLLAAMLEAGWVITASWPIDTENAGRLRARNSAVLGSSIHLVCRPREYPDGRLITDTVGDWRDILAALPQRIHEWMPRLAREGIVGADAIFACLGPALELFSRFARVEKVSGAVVSLAEYLEQVWAAVSREALAMIFADADATGLEPDARLTAMWLWTLVARAHGKALSPNGRSADAADTSNKAGKPNTADKTNMADKTDKTNMVTDADQVAEESTTTTKPGFSLEFDSARKIAQGLGARLEELTSIVEVKGNTARLRAVVERSAELLGTEAASESHAGQRKRQIALCADDADAAAESSWPQQGQGNTGSPDPGPTTLARVHQAMLLFGTGHGDSLRHFLIDHGVGKQPMFWRLSQSLAALYPAGSNEKRWVEGVMARKKGLGFG